MSKAAFDLAGTLEPSSKIYYESVFSQFQIGRVVDLLTAIADGTGTDLSALRNVLNSGLSEACQFQGLFNTSIGSPDPVTIEFGHDATKLAISILFTVDSEYREAFETAVVAGLAGISKPSQEITVQYHPETGRAAILCVMPHDLSATEVLNEPEQKTPVRLIRIGNDETLNSATGNDETEYVELGDVEYSRLLAEKTGSPDETREETTNKILEAATASTAKAEAEISQEIDGLLEKGHSHGETLEALSKTISRDQMIEAIKRNFSNDEVAALIAEGNTEQIARALKEGLSEEEMTQLASEVSSNVENGGVAGSALSVTEKAKILAELAPAKSVEALKKALKHEKLANILADQLTEEELIDGELADVKQANAKRLLKKPSQKLASSRTKKDQAKTLAKGNPRFAAKVIQKNSTPEEIASLLMDTLTEEDQGEILSEGLTEEEISKVVQATVPELEKAKLIAKSKPQDVAKKIQETASPEEIGELLSTALSKEELAQAISKGLPEEEVAQIVKGAMTQEDLARAVSGGLPEKDLAQLIKGSMTEKELARLVKGGLPEKELAQLVKGCLNEKEIKTIIKGSNNQDWIAEAVIVGSTPKDAAALIKASLSETEIGEAIKEHLPKEKLAKAAVEVLPAEDLIRFAQKSLTEEDFIQTIAKGLTQPQIANLAVAALEDPVSSKAILQHFSAEDLAKSLKAALPLEKLRMAAQAHLSDEEIFNTLRSGLPKEEYARIVASALPREEFSRILANGLPPQEIARALADGLPKEKFAALISIAVPKAELSKSLADAGYDAKGKNLKQAPNAPTQTRFEPRQVAALLKPSVTQKEAISVLSTVLPKDAAESIFTGMIPHSEIVQTLKECLPTPELAISIANSLAKLSETPLESSESESIKNPFGKTKSPATKDLETANRNLDFAQEKAKLQGAFDTRIASSKKAVEFYLARTRSLETQLRAAEDQNRKSQQNAEKSKRELERIIATDESVQNQNETKDDPNSSPGSELPGETTVSSLKAKRDQEALKFFQKKAREFEVELRRSEGEIRRLNAEHTKELLKVSEVKPEKPDETPKNLPNIHEDPKKLTPSLSKEVSPGKNNEDEDDLGKNFLNQQIKGLEAKLRLALDEKKNLLDKLNQQKDQKSTRRPDLPDQSRSQISDREPDQNSVQDRGKMHERDPEQVHGRDPGQTSEHGIEQMSERNPGQLSNQKVALPAASGLDEKLDPASNLRSVKPGEKGHLEESTELTQNGADPRVARSPGATSADSLSELGEEMELMTEKTEKELTTIVRTMGRSKEGVKDDPTKRAVEGLMGTIVQEKSKLAEMTKELTKSIRKKELNFKNQEAKLTEELRQAKAIVEQKESNVERLKQAMQEMRQKLELEKNSLSQSASTENQYRLKFEQGQRQIETLNREIEKANRRTQANPGQQTNSATQQHQNTELKKQIETSTKALNQKKQEYDVLKAQLSEREKKDVEYKRTIMKLQAELNSARIPPKKAA